MLSDETFPPEKRELLRIALGAAVPLWIHEFRKLTPEERIKIVRECGDIVAEKGDVIQFKSKKRGETAKAFNALAKGIAVLAFSPGGVTFLGDHYEATLTPD